MIFEFPRKEQIPQLLEQWKQVFGDWNGFWELFLETGFSPDRCRCILEENRIIAALTWLDCHCGGRKMAYIYAVMTDPSHRGKGLCRQLLEDTHRLLLSRGYDAALLVPAEEGLRAMYRKLGYETCTWVEEWDAVCGSHPADLRAIGPGEFAGLRRQLLPFGSVLQEQENLAFLSRQAQFYAGEDFLLTAYTGEGKLTAMELLGNTAAAPGILRALHCRTGHFRCPGQAVPFAMIHPLTGDALIPRYFGFAFD